MVMNRLILNELLREGGNELFRKDDEARIDAGLIVDVLTRACYQANCALRRNTRGFM
jgi:hypothetical protein